MRLRLSAVEVGNLIRKKRWGKHCDGGGLYLQGSEAFGTWSWLFRFKSPRLGREVWMGLGSKDTFSLKEARERAKQCRQVLAQGIDPCEQRRLDKDEARKDAASTISFKDAAEAYMKVHEGTLNNAKHRAQWKTTLAEHYKTLGSRPVSSIDEAVVNEALLEVWKRAPETARRTGQRIHRVVKWVRDGRPLPHKVERRHHAAMPLEAVPIFMTRIRRRDSISARALEFTILTAARTSETIGATWDEIKGDLWVIPASRMKAKREHVVPLSKPVLALLEALPRVAGCPYLFPSVQTGKPISNMAMLELLKGMDGNGFTVHGFRSAFRDWAGDEAEVDDEIAEHALAHQVRDKVKASYRRKTAINKRRKLMEDWANYCATPAVELVEEVA